MLKLRTLRPWAGKTARRCSGTATAIEGGVSIMSAAVDAGAAAVAECPVERSEARALHPRHVLNDCADHVSQFIHPAFVQFQKDTGACVIWGDQCATESHTKSSFEPAPMKTTQWMVSPTLVPVATGTLGMLCCTHDHSGHTILGVGGNGRYLTTSPATPRSTLRLFAE